MSSVITTLVRKLESSTQNGINKTIYHLEKEVNSLQFSKENCYPVNKNIPIHINSRYFYHLNLFSKNWFGKILLKTNLNVVIFMEYH